MTKARLLDKNQVIRELLGGHKVLRVNIATNNTVNLFNTTLVNVDKGLRSDDYVYIAIEEAVTNDKVKAQEMD